MSSQASRLRSTFKYVSSKSAPLAERAFITGGLLIVSTANETNKRRARHIAKYVPYGAPALFIGSNNPPGRTL